MFTKKYLYPICSILFMISIVQAEKYTPENTKFAFDLHKVIVQPSKNRIYNGLVNRNMLPEVNMQLPLTLAKVAAYLPPVSYYTAKLLYEGGTGEQYYTLFQYYDYNRLAQAVINIANDQTPISGTVNIIQELKDKGYMIDLASDIGQTFLPDLMKKYPSTFDMIADKQTVDYINTNQPIHKPSIQYFQDYLEKYGNGKTIIFIDDKEKNVAAAKQAGMIGIVFKDPEQLRKDLVKMGILKQ